MKSIINSGVGAGGHTYEVTISHRDTMKHKACFISETVFFKLRTLLEINKQ
jgi:hypothetical protein